MAVCELCLTAVHKNCYMQDLSIFSVIPPEGWYCQRCVYLQTYSYDLEEPPKCIFCPEARGIMIKLISGPCNGSWVHVTCVNFLSMRNQKVIHEEKVDFATNDAGYKLTNQLLNKPNF